MLDLSQFSQENLNRIQKVLKIVLDELELHGNNRLIGSAIPIEKFQKEGFSRIDVIAILNRINGKDELIRLVEESFDPARDGFYPQKTEIEKIGFLSQKREETERYINFLVINLKKLKEIKQSIDEAQRHKAQPINITSEIFKDTIPIRPASEMMKEADIANRELYRQSFEKQLHRESLKQQRILATKEDKYAHTVNTITEWAEYYGDGKSFPLDYYYFNFEDRMDDSKMLERFLDKLKDAGCFKGWSRTNYTGGTKFVFIEVSLEKLKSYKENRSKIETKNTEIDTNSPVLIFYNKEAGVGYVGKKSFKFKDHQPEYRVFAKLYDGINKKIARANVLALMGLKETLNFVSEEDSGDIKKVSRETATYEITELAKKIRERTSLTINTLVLNNGNLTLLGTKLKNSPE